MEFTYGAGFTLIDFSNAMQFVAEYAALRGPIAIMSEVRGAAPAGAGERRRLAEIVSELDAKTKGQVCASAVVTESGLMRGVLTAVSWVHSPVYPLKPFASEDDARAWLREHLAKAS
ncbi:MAG: STAS/SEC14 domain-containing protein [Myxococcales bacterium]|nr:STAS/SEC14 domain-containing protein [Myxococcales bacterium]